MPRLLTILPPLLVLMALAWLLPAQADELQDPPLVTAETRATIERGLKFLAGIQAADGSWHSNAGKKINESYKPFDQGVDVPHVGVTSLAILSFLAGGHLPGRGPFGDVVNKAVNFVLDQAQPSGMLLSGTPGSTTRVYSHAFATLALAEVYGMAPHPRIRAVLENAVDFTVRCQNETGGWRYVPFTADSDMSVTVCQVVALRAARNVGFKVPQATIERALNYVIKSAYTGVEAKGGFRYQPEEIRWNRDSFSLAAAGLTTLFQAGLYDNASIASYVKRHKIPQDPPPRIEDTIRYLRAQYLEVPRDHFFFWYGCYYATQAFYLVGASNPREWVSWYTTVRDQILSNQRRTADAASGAARSHWESNIDTSHAYATATALLILQFPLDYLPIHQR